MTFGQHNFQVTKETIDFIINVLRQGTIKWPGRAECLRRARKKVLVGETKSGKPRYKLHWKCAKCGQWFKDQSEMEVDHIVEIGSFSGSWDDFINRMYCEQDNLQALCQVCHKKKTIAFNNASLRYRRKNEMDSKD